MRALTAEEALVPPTTCFDVGHRDERLRMHQNLRRGFSMRSCLVSLRPEAFHPIRMVPAERTTTGLAAKQPRGKEVLLSPFEPQLHNWVGPCVRYQAEEGPRRDTSDAIC